MGSPSLEDDLRVAIDTAVAGSMLALDHRAEGVEVSTKPDGSVVTTADVAVEALLRSSLGAVRPHDAVLGEEGGLHGDGARRWILDPIDGTTSFVAGRPDWGVHVALEVDGEIVAGVVTRPVQGALWWAGRGLGAHRATLAAPDVTTRLQVSAAADLQTCRVTSWVEGEPGVFDRFTALSGWRAPLDLDCGLRVVSGELDVLVERSPARIWDRAPYAVLVEEAGGRFRDLDGGRSCDGGGGSLTNAHLGDQLDALLNRSG